MSIVTIEIGALQSDPDLKEGSIITLERSDGRSVWRQRLRIIKRIDLMRGPHYVAEAIGDTE